MKEKSTICGTSRCNPGHSPEVRQVENSLTTFCSALKLIEQTLPQDSKGMRRPVRATKSTACFAHLMGNQTDAIFSLWTKKDLAKHKREFLGKQREGR